VFLSCSVYLRPWKAFAAINAGSEPVRRGSARTCSGFDHAARPCAAAIRIVPAPELRRVTISSRIFAAAHMAGNSDA
jgi:hypothetical protein